MTDQIAYQEYIQRRYNAFCKTVIRCAALDKILKLKRQWERQVSLDYLMNEKFVQFAASEPDEEYPFTVCGQNAVAVTIRMPVSLISSRSASSCRRCVSFAAGVSNRNWSTDIW